MSFPDLDDVTKRPPPKPHWAQRWLREIFVEDLGLKILALVIAVALWYGVTGQRTPTTIRVPRVPLNFRLPSDTEISNEPRMEVEVTLTGNKRDLDSLNVRDLMANVDVTDLKPGEHYVQLTHERVTMGLPDGVRYGDIQPNNVLLRLEPRVERELPVEVTRSGEVPEGYELRGITVTPDKVKVRGPASHVALIKTLQTEEVSLEGRKESFTLPQVMVQIADRKVDLITTVVSVQVEIEERRVEKTFRNVTVVASDGTLLRPSTADVKLYGPRSVVEGLRAQDIRLVLETAQDGSRSLRLELPEGLQGRVELRSPNPSAEGFLKLPF